MYMVWYAKAEYGKNKFNRVRWGMAKKLMVVLS